MKIVIAPQEFKESLRGIEIAQAMREGVSRVWPDAETLLVPVADGGDGTLQSLVDASDGELITATVDDPLGRPIEAVWGALGDGRTAVIEMARSSGLAILKPEERDPLTTTTYGVGQLMSLALDAGYRHLIIGIGGSATNDGGAGMAQALGASLLDSNGNELARGGGALAYLSQIDVSGLDVRLSETKIDVACDVNNPLCGETGASAIFGPQKGADAETVAYLDNALHRYGNLLQRDLGRDVMEVPGAGAAGGLGAGLMAFTDAQLRPGADIVIDALDLDTKLEGASLVIVGEGQTDRSTTFHKAPVAVAQKAKSVGTPVIAISGSLGDGYQLVHDHGIDAAFSILDCCMTLEDAMSDTAELVTKATEQACRALSVDLAK
ncbi:MAG: glycerate kinase [Chloroflexi bacterium]|nr:glycerate kinase [Chloroflexota bacterium]